MYFKTTFISCYVRKNATKKYTVYTAGELKPCKLGFSILARLLFASSYDRYTVDKINWWLYCLSRFYEIFDHFSLFDETLRHIDLCAIASYSEISAKMCPTAYSISILVQYIRYILFCFFFTDYSAIPGEKFRFGSGQTISCST